METSETIVRKKKRVSKKHKKSWIKHIDNKDVEDFLDEQRQLERLGGSFVGKKDEELFLVDEGGAAPKEKTQLTKKEKARLPLKCFANLVNNCPIPDPVGRRTKVRTKEERKDRIVKSKEEARRRLGIIPRKVLTAQTDRARTLRQKRKEPKELVSDKDIWADNNKGAFIGKDTAWLGDATLTHHVGPTGTRLPKDLVQKKSVLPAVETPHPGSSYNPSLKDHQDLLKTVAEKEVEKLKEEEHIKRVTSDIFRKVTIRQKEAQWLEEMSEGLKKDGEGEEGTEGQTLPDGGPLSLNPPTSFQNKKTLKQRRKIMELKQAALARKYAKIEKKKLADIYKLRFIQKEIEGKTEKEKIAAQIREKKAEMNVAKTKRLAALKYSEPELEFNRKCELRGNLRSIQKAGSLLAERFYSLQKRNILAPTAKVTRFPKAKVKRFTKPSHKLEGVELVSGQGSKKKRRRGSKKSA